MSWRPLVVVAALAVAAGHCNPAAAYGWGYSPWTGASNFQWLYRSLGYPLNRISSIGAPYYLINPLLYNATYSVAKGTGAGRRQVQFQQVQAYQQGQQYQQASNFPDQEPFTYGTQRQRQLINSPYPVNQVGYSPWTMGGPAPEWNGPDPVADYNNGTASAGNGSGMFTGSPQAVAAAAPLLASTAQALPTAPPFTRASGDENASSAPFAASAAPAADGPAGANTANNPFAGAFIHLVQDKFKGNIARALKDKQARSLARSLGVIPEGNFDADDIPLERLALIEKILGDQNESPAVRLSSVRLLLKH